VPACCVLAVCVTANFVSPFFFCFSVSIPVHIFRFHRLLFIFVFVSWSSAFYLLPIFIFCLHGELFGKRNPDVPIGTLKKPVTQ
jgi:hypothetical protein